MATKKNFNEIKVGEEPKETKLIGLYNADEGETEMLRVTAEQLKVIYFLFNSGYLDIDNIIENPVPVVTDLTK